MGPTIRRRWALPLLSAMVALVALPGCATTPDPVYPHAAVATDHREASAAGVEILLAGGNAVDAAVAASFALSVVRPNSCGIGGGGFMLIEGPETRVAVNYRETCPAAVGPSHFVSLGTDPEMPAPSRYGPHAVGIPGTVAGLLWAQEHHGRLDRRRVLEPAIRLASWGFDADRNYVEAVAEAARVRAEHPVTRATTAYFWRQLCHAGRVEVGDRITNPRQAEALRLIAAHGRDGFYAGPVADAIVAAMGPGDGAITRDDLAAYEPFVTEPLVGEFFGRTILTMPPPSSGGIAMLQVFGLLERHAARLGLTAHNDPAYIHLVTESLKHAFADRARWLADWRFVSVPVEPLLDATYLDELAARIDPDRTLERVEYGTAIPVPDDSGTSHISVIDADGMAVACTETINTNFGSMVGVEAYGFILNNEMDDFTTIPGAANYYGLRQSDRNLPQPGKRPLSSMSPTIVLDGDRPVVVAGGSGGPRIITGTIQCVLNAMLFGMTPRDAVEAPRFHHQWMPETLQFEERWTDRAAIAAMRDLGHETAERRHVGKVQMIGVGPDGIRAASDSRKAGLPAGY